MNAVNQSINELMVMTSQTSKTSLGTISPPILNTPWHLSMAASFSLNWLCVLPEWAECTVVAMRVPPRIPRGTELDFSFRPLNLRFYVI